MWLMRCWAFSSLCFEALEYRWVCLSLNRSYRLSSICLPGNHTLVVHGFQISRGSGGAQLRSVGLLLLFFTCHSVGVMLVPEKHSLATVWFLCLQRTTSREHPPRRQHRLPGGGEVPEDPAGGGTGARPGVQALPPQHHLPEHGAGVSHHRRGMRLGLSPPIGEGMK